MAVGAKMTPTGTIRKWFRAEYGTFVMALVIISMSIYLIFPMVILFVFSFDMSRDAFVPPREWGLGNWTSAWDDPASSRRSSTRSWFGSG